MIEKQLENVLACASNIPKGWANAIKKSRCQKDERSYEICWQSLLNCLSKSDELHNFWTSIGLENEEEIKNLLEQFKKITLVIVMYWGLDYIYKTTAKPEIFNFDYLNRIFNEEPLLYRNFFTVDKIECRRETVREKIYTDTRKSAHNLIKDAFSLNDTRTINPFLVREQNKDYSTQFNGEKLLLKSYYPEITEYIHNSFREIIVKDTGEKKIEILSLSRLLALFLLDSANALPAHRNTKSGKISLLLMEKLCNKFNDSAEFADPLFMDLALKDVEIGEKTGQIIYTLGIEDLLHLNRLSYAIKSFCEYVDKREKKLSKKQSMLVLMAFIPLSYAPTTEIQRIMNDDIVSFADNLLKNGGLTEQYNAMTSTNFRRVLAINGIISPLLAYSMSSLLYEKFEEAKPNIELIKKSLPEIIAKADTYADYYETLFIPSEKIWENTHFFEAYEENKGSYNTNNGSKKNTLRKYRYALSFRCMISPDDILTAFLTQEAHVWKRRSIIDCNKLGVLPIDILSETSAESYQRKLDEMSYLELLGFAFCDEILKDMV